MKKLDKELQKLDMEKLAADFGYTMDGGEAGSLEDETFSADGATIIVNGVISHPGYAKNKLVNALKVGEKFCMHFLLKNGRRKLQKKKKDLFIRFILKGLLKEPHLEFIIRDFDDEKLKESGEKLKADC